jgi:hypothetical protein
MAASTTSAKILQAETVDALNVLLANMAATFEIVSVSSVSRIYGVYIATCVYKKG